MSTEVEAKFIVAEPAMARRIRGLSRLDRFSLLEGRESTIQDDYLDTPEGSIRAAGFACRRRQEAGREVTQLKSIAARRGDEPAIHRREEQEPGPARLQELAAGRPLQVLFTLTQQRFVRDVMDGPRRVAMASLDEVSLVAGADSRQWRELEIELAPEGTEPELAAISGWVRATLGLHPAGSSKFERALQLLDTARRSGSAPPTGTSVVLDAPPGDVAEFPAAALAGMGYPARVRRRVEDHVVFYDTHDAAFMKKGYTLSWSRSSSTWRLREDGRVQAEEPGPGDRVPLEGPIGAALGTIPAEHPSIPLLEGALVQTDYGVTGIGSDPLRLRVRRWTFSSPLVPAAPKPLLRLTVSGPASGLAYFCGLLQSQLGFRVSRDPLLDMGLSRLGLTAPGAGVPKSMRVEAQDSVAQAAGKVLRGEAWRMRMNRTGAIRDLHPEFVHDLRVATRRARSAGRLFGFLLPADDAAALRDELRWIARLLGAVRDLDVLLSRLDTQLTLAGSPSAPSGFVRDRIRDRRERSLVELRDALGSPRFDALLDRLESIVIAEADPAMSAAAFARKRIDKRFRKLAPWIERPADSLSDAELHGIRILFKRLRYACEFFRPVLGSDAEPLIGSFVALQDCLGLHQDAATAARLLTEALGQAPAEARTEELLLSMGSLLQIQRDVQQVQRKAFARRWAAASEILDQWRRVRDAGSRAPW